MTLRAWRLCTLMLLCVLIPCGWAIHASWHDHYTDYLGTRCCTTDCIPLPVSLVSQEGNRVQLLVAGVLLTLPAGSVHLSEDTQSWICARNPQMPATAPNIRCAFVAFGS